MTPTNNHAMNLSPTPRSNAANSATNIDKVDINNIDNVDIGKLTDNKFTPRLSREIYRLDARQLAQRLLGQTLVHLHEGERVAGIIVETEAYLGVIDKASHAYAGRRTQRTEVMYADGGTVYVFLNYGIHNMLNVVAGVAEDPQAVLIRAVAPTAGIDGMYARRPKAKKETDLCSGPGKLGAAFGIDRSHNGIDLVQHDLLFIEQTTEPLLPDRIITSPRIGIDYAAEWASAPLRFRCQTPLRAPPAE
jgi:DNA-3-methyladenine glycosylase